MAAATHAVLLKRSDAQVYLVHTSANWEEAAAILGLNQAFVVEPILIMPRTVASAPIIDEPCIMLMNGWFFAPSDEEAAVVMMRSRNSSAADAHEDLDSTASGPPSSCGDVAPNNEQGRTPHTTTDAANDAEGDASLWKYLVACRSQEATKAVDIRAALASKLGKTEAARLLAHCSATVAKSADGQKKRVLKAPTGELLKMK